MKPKILLHHTNHNLYRSMVKNLIQHHSEDLDIILQIIHGNLFRLFNEYKPTVVFLPVAEYTQELHDFIQEYNSQVKISLLVDREIDNPKLIQFWKDVGLYLVTAKGLSDFPVSDHGIEYPALYDSDIFSNTNAVRNNKVAVILTSDQNQNEQVLSSWLYPQNADSKLVLFNNPEFKHPQNVGIFNNTDLNIILNSFSYLIDIDNKYNLEALVCGIQNLDIDKIEDINNVEKYSIKTLSLSTEDLSQRTYRFFVQNNLIPFLIKS